MIKLLLIVSSALKTLMDTNENGSEKINPQTMNFTIIHITNVTLENHFGNLETKQIQAYASKNELDLMETMLGTIQWKRI